MFYLGIFLIVYSLVVFWITFKKPAAIWRMGKIQGFVKILGEPGTQLFFVIFGLASLGIGLWLTLANWPA